MSWIAYVPLLLLFVAGIGTQNSVSDGGSTSPCPVDQYEDVDRGICLDLCGVNLTQCREDQFCSSRKPLWNIDPAKCMDYCHEKCTTVTYCQRVSKDCEPCSGICHSTASRNECRVKCYDVYRYLPPVVTDRVAIVTTLQPSTTTGLTSVKPTDVISADVTTSKFKADTIKSNGKNTTVLVTAILVPSVVVIAVLLVVIIVYLRRKPKRDCDPERDHTPVPPGEETPSEQTVLIPLIDMPVEDSGREVFKDNLRAYNQELMRMLHDDDERRGSTAIKLDHYQVPSLSVEYKELHVKETTIAHKDLKDIVSADSKKVLLLGGAGSGKTTLCHYIMQCHLDRTSDNTWNKEFDFVFLVPLRHHQGNRAQISLSDLLFERARPGNNSSDFTFDTEKDQRRTLILIDGADEIGDDVTSGYAICPDINKATSITVLLDHLIKGNLLHGAHVIVTSRPHCAQFIQKTVNKTMWIGELTAVQVDNLIRATLGATSDEVISFLHEETTISNLCRIPGIAQDFLIYVSWSIQERENQSSMTSLRESLPQTMTQLHSKMIVASLGSNCRSIQDRDMSESSVWANCSEHMNTHSALAGKQLLHYPLQLRKNFDLDQVEEAGIDGRQAGDYGLLTSFKESINHPFFNFRTLFCFLRFSRLEFCAALFLVHDIMTTASVDIARLAKVNTGQIDDIFKFTCGLLTHPDCRIILEKVHKSNCRSMDWCLDKAYDLVELILRNDRRPLDKRNSFCLSLIMESQLSHINQDMTTCIQHVPDMIAMYAATSADFKALGYYVQTAKATDTVLLNTIRLLYTTCNGSLRHILTLKAMQNYDGLQLRHCQLSEVDHKALIQALNRNHKLGSIELCGNFIDALFQNQAFKLFTAPNNSIKCLLLKELGQFELEQVCENIAQFSQLEALVVHMRPQSVWYARSMVNKLAEVKTLRQLVMAKCDLMADVVGKLFSSKVLMRRLVLLDVSDNIFGDVGAAHIAEAICKEDCVLKSLFADNCGFTQNGVMQILTSKNRMLTTLSVGRRLRDHQPEIATRPDTTKTICGDLPEIQQLIVGGQTISASLLSGLLKRTNVLRLDIEGCWWDDGKGASHVPLRCHKGLIKMCNTLETLCFTAESGTDVELVAQIIAKGKLKCLVLSLQRVPSITAICKALEGSTSVEELWITFWLSDDEIKQQQELGRSLAKNTTLLRAGFDHDRDAAVVLGSMSDALEPEELLTLDKLFVGYSYRLDIDDKLVCSLESKMGPGCVVPIDIRDANHNPVLRRCYRYKGFLRL